MRPVWIVGYPRTGSRLLTSYLNATGLFNPPIDEWLRIAPTMLYPYSMVHEQHFMKCFSMEDKAVIEKTLPGLRYIWLRRRDLIATTVSTFIARSTQVYYVCNKQEVQDHMDMPVKCNNTDSLISLYLDICQRDDFWKHYLSDSEHATTYYEDIEDDVHRIFDFLDINQRPVNPKKYHRLQHPMTSSLCKKLQIAIDSGNVEYSPWTKSHFEQPIPLL